ncbi:hypothetical protein MRX96_043974 [Rhipicephalus microplus]
MRLIHAFEGRDLLLRLGYISQFHDAARRKPIPDQLRATYKVAPIPRNMDPRLHQGRREARVEALERTYAHKNTTYYVDAANYDHANNKAVATVVDHTLTERTSAFVRCRNITDAEETAIALALALGYRQRRLTSGLLRHTERHRQSLRKWTVVLPRSRVARPLRRGSARTEYSHAFSRAHERLIRGARERRPRDRKPRETSLESIGMEQRATYRLPSMRPLDHGMRHLPQLG